MIIIYHGTDTSAARAALSAATGTDVTRITDIHSIDALREALWGVSLFGEVPTIVCEYVLENDTLRDIVLKNIEELASASTAYYFLEGKLDATTKKTLSKHAILHVYDVRKESVKSTIFAVADALKRGDRKRLWIAYQHELSVGTAPEAIHGMLFWAAKDMYTNSRTDTDRVHAQRLIRTLSALVHETRRQGDILQYTLEQFVLSNI
jgi:hypothetical protein